MDWFKAKGPAAARLRKRKYELLLSHKMLFFRKHNGVRAANIYKATLGLSTAFKLLWWMLVNSLQRGRPANRERMHLHWYLLKHILDL